MPCDLVSPALEDARRWYPGLWKATWDGASVGLGDQDAHRRESPPAGCLLCPRRRPWARAGWLCRPQCVAAQALPLQPGGRAPARGT